MSRSFGMIFADMWEDEHFRTLSRNAQCTYCLLRSQEGVNAAGILILRVEWWSKSQADLTADQVRCDIDELWQAGFVLPDYETDELLIRYLVRKDGLYRKPNSVIAAGKAAKGAKSPEIKGALCAEFRTIANGLTEPVATADVVVLVNELIGHLDRFDVHSQMVRERFADGPSNGLRLHAGTPVDTAQAGSGHIAVTPVISSGTTSGSVEDPRPKNQDLRKPSSPAADAAGGARPEIDELCQHLIDRLRSNGVTTRLVITQKWRTATRLMLDKDGRSVAQVRNMIDWCQDDEFWRSNVMSMPTLREQYEQLRLKALASVNGRHRPDPRYTAGSGQMAAPAPSGTGVRI